MWLSLCLVLVLCSADELLIDLKKMWARQARSARSDFFNTTFPALYNIHKRGQPVTEQRYPWIARVVHSRSESQPHICTASCIEKRIFVTAARCIYSLKVEFTTVHYQNQVLPARALVLPSKPTKQMFDDVGFVVVEDEPSLPRWSTVKTFNTVNRTDGEFMWLQNLNWQKTPQEQYVVGYAADDNTTKYQLFDTIFELTEIKIIIDMALCNEVTSMDTKSDATDFWVPCYYSCGVDADPSDEACQPYHGVEGGAVFDKAKNMLIGVATWGGYDEENIPLPVGFSVLNSDNYYEDRECSLIIRDSGKLDAKGYQSLCER